MLGRLYSWVVRRFGGQTLLIWALLGLLVGSAAAAMATAAGQALSGPRLAATGLLGALCAWVLSGRAANSPGGRVEGDAPAAPAAGSAPAAWAGAPAVLLLALLGATWALLTAGGLLGPLLGALASGLALLEAWLFDAALPALQTWLSNLAGGAPAPLPSLPDPGPFLAQLSDLGRRLAALLSGLAWLPGELAAGQCCTGEPRAVRVDWLLAAWATGAWAGWFTRRDRALPAGLPALLLPAAVLGYAHKTPLFLFPPLAAWFALLAGSAFARRRRAWRAAGIDASEDLAFDLALWSGALVLGVLSLAYALAVFSPQEAYQDLRRALGGPAGEPPGESLGLPRPAQAGVLPRLHLLGAGPQLSLQPVMSVQVLDNGAGGPGPVPPSAYWLGVSYDHYTGHGWYSAAPTVWDFPAGAPLPSQGIPAAPPSGSQPSAEEPHGWEISLLVQPVDRLARQVYAPGQALALDRPYRAEFRPAPLPPGDLFQLALRRPAGSGYTVRARLPAAGETALRAAPPGGPAWLVERYTQLPPDLPERLRRLARLLTAGQSSAYDQARAIETYLRAIPYTLDLPAPPPDRDVADYFLFDLRRGFCDYSATAMVVLARAAGLPARLGVGYAAGRYDPSGALYQVTQAEAHSWPEIYFVGYGWVVFEPSGSRPADDFSARAAQPPTQPTAPGSAQAAPAQPPPRPSAVPDQPTGALLTLCAALLALTAAWGLPRLDELRLQRMPSGPALAELHNRLRAAARRLDAPLYPGQTPLELAEAVEARLAAQTGLQISPQPAPQLVPQLAPQLAPPTRPAVQLAGLISAAAYSSRPPDLYQQRQALRAWRALRRALWRAAWAARLARLRRIYPPGPPHS
ncbi:MAG: transglutaminase domain-containing protein [Chloroflexota bacterium]